MRGNEQSSKAHVVQSEMARFLARRSGITIELGNQVTRLIIQRLTEAIVKKKRIEIRDFGVFLAKYRAPRSARNPKTGETIQTKASYSVSFKPGKALKDRVDQG